MIGNPNAALRHFFDNLQRYHGVAVNPASSVRGPRYSAREGKTPAFDDRRVRKLLDPIDQGDVVGVRDRALLMAPAYTAALAGEDAPSIGVERPGHGPTRGCTASPSGDSSSSSSGARRASARAPWSGASWTGCRARSSSCPGDVTSASRSPTRRPTASSTP